MDLDALDQCTDDVTLGVELQRGQTIVDGRGEFLQPVDHQKQLDLTGMLALGCVDLCLHLLQLDFQLSHLGIEIDFVDKPLGIAVNEPRFASL
jgi:hypothetical protein